MDDLPISTDRTRCMSMDREVPTSRSSRALRTGPVEKDRKGLDDDDDGDDGVEAE